MLAPFESAYLAYAQQWHTVVAIIDESCVSAVANDAWLSRRRRYSPSTPHRHGMHEKSRPSISPAMRPTTMHGQKNVAMHTTGERKHEQKPFA